MERADRVEGDDAAAVVGVPEPARSLRPPARLVVGPASDAAERDADRIAEALTSSSGPVAIPTARRSTRVRRSATSRGMPAVQPDVEARIHRATGRGQPIPNPIRSDFEARLSTSLVDVSIHSDSDLPVRVQASAFTVGSDIFLSRDENLRSATGRRTLAHEVGHVVQNRAGGDVASSGTIRRKALTTSDVIDALKKIDIVKQYLGATPDSVNARDSTKLQTVRKTVERILKSYKSDFQTGADETTASAMKVAIVLEQVAKVIALNELNDPALGPLLATKLFQIYSAELSGAVRKRDDGEDVLKLAGALTAADPVARYMHDEISLVVAAREVRVQANLASKEPKVMFDLLSQKFEAEAATWTRNRVNAVQDTGNSAGSFSVSETNSELSTDYFDKLFGTAAAKGTTSQGPTRKRAAFDAGAAAKLKSLGDEVDKDKNRSHGYTGDAKTWKRLDPTTGATTETHSLTHLQSAHLAGVDAADSVAYATVDARVAQVFEGMYSMNPAEAAQLVVQVKTALARQPITLTVDAQSWFGQGHKPARGSKYQAASGRTSQTSYQSILGRAPTGGPQQVDHLGNFNDTSGQERTENYGRFRNWKDRKMALASNVQLPDSDLPNFAALNANWNAHSSQVSQTTAEKPYGTNSYGNLHLHLRKAHLAGRILYTAGDHGKPHADPFFALADFLLADTREDSATGLKIPKDEVFANTLIVGITTTGKFATGVQKFEAQIFGEIDVIKDVEKVSVAPSVTNLGLIGNIQQFAADAQAAFEQITDPGGPIPYTMKASKKSMIAQVQAALAPKGT